MLMTAMAKIEAQQPEERTAVWTVGEQLKDMLRAHPAWAELIAQDLDKEGMGLAGCEKKIREYADKHRTGSFSCVAPAEAEDIIREFYGLSGDAGRPDGLMDIDLADFM